MQVYSAQNQLDAQRVADSLESAGIECRVHGAFLSGAVGELPPDGLLTVWIKEPTHYDRARDIVKMIEREALLPGGRPVSCGHCGEQLESQFSHCWQCGKEISETS